MLQTIKEPIPEQKPSLLTHEIKEEVKTVNVEIPASKTRRKPKGMDLFYSFLKCFSYIVFHVGLVLFWKVY